VSEVEPLRALLDRAQAQHGAAPAEFAHALSARAAALAGDADAGEAVRLAEHLWLGHLADAAALAAFLDALPAALHETDAVQRTRWAIAMFEGRSAPVPPAASRWRALQNIVSALAATGRAAQAQAMLLAEEDAARHGADTAARQACAASANNVALDLRLGPRGDAGRDALMLVAAELARRAWAAAGTWMHLERAEYQLALCHAVLGRGDAALHHAARCLAVCDAEGADAVERFFAHEALAHAHRACGNAHAAAPQVDAMRALLPAIADDDTRDWCAHTLDALLAA
jgi:hypothetical protein